MRTLMNRIFPQRNFCGPNHFLDSELTQRYLDETSGDCMSDLSIRSKDFIKEEATRAAKRTVDTGKEEQNPYDTQIAAASVWYSEYVRQILHMSHLKYSKEAA